MRHSFVPFVRFVVRSASLCVGCGPGVATPSPSWDPGTLPSHARIPLSLPLSTHAHAAASSPFTSHLRHLRSCRTDEPRIPPCCHREKPSLNAVAYSSSSSRLHHRPCNACPCGLGSATPSSLPWTPVHAALAPPPSLVLAQQLGKTFVTIQSNVLTPTTMCNHLKQ